MALPYYVLDQQNDHRQKVARDLTENVWRQTEADSKARAQRELYSQSVGAPRSTPSDGSAFFGLLIIVSFVLFCLPQRQEKPASAPAKVTAPARPQKEHPIRKGFHPKHTKSGSKKRTATSLPPDQVR